MTIGGLADRVSYSPDLIPFMTPEEVAECLNLPPRTIYRAAREGKIKGCKVGRAVRLTPEDVAFSTFISFPHKDSAEKRLGLCRDLYAYLFRGLPDAEKRLEYLDVALADKLRGYAEEWELEKSILAQA